MVKLDKSIGESPDLWLRLAAEDYVTTRVLILSGLHRLGAYHMQQAVEKYLKAFILKHYEIDGKNKIKSCKDNKGKEVPFNKHYLDKLLYCCQQKDEFFKEEGVGTFIDMLYSEKLEVDFNNVRYNYQFTIDLTTKVPGTLLYLDYFVKKVRELVNTNIGDVIDALQERPNLNLNELNFAGGMAFKDLGKLFFEENDHFKPLNSSGKNISLIW